MAKAKVYVIGLGYVGLPLALLTQSKGYLVTGVDFDSQKVTQINKGISPFVDDEITSQLNNNPVRAQDSYKDIESADIIVVCVPTPVDTEFMPDLGPVRAACKEIGSSLQKDQLIIIESTINPGVCDDEIIPLLEKYSGLRCGRDFSVAHCPERINPGDKTWNVANIPRVVGANDSRSLGRATDFYEAIIDGTIKPMGSLKEAEAVKVVENSFRDINIAFVNELAMSFSMLGIDVVNVIDGAATKPFAFMPHYPGAGVGGHCIPVDPYYLIEYAKTKGFTHKFLAVARDINNSMPDFVVQRLIEARDSDSDLEGLHVAVLGLSYKPNVGDLRESPALKIVKILASKGAIVKVHDPYIDSSNQSFSKLENVEIKNSLKEALTDVKAVLVVTAHDEFLNLNFKTIADNGTTIIIDGRNCLNKQKVEAAGIIYKGIGR
ncbi:MAG: UDP-N-acetyl-D-glucosamine dehydrogenase [Patescibacteria group bacterium]|jgi:UDP-N-acetyl-D-glucosamine dehydrogenase|nr:UDP-N-acetyl-D-glucosamine dehydrogenase [Patescibacteria group bacterium]